ncbi:site-specific integrase [Vibrio rotiferianus]|uniref:site-specific integrase n=1 Tax=Vibrio rotiferianus TaxID=190895 RepID=UPI00406A46A1
MSLQTMKSVGSTANQIIIAHNLMTNSGSTPLSFERPIPKSHKIVKPKTCFEVLAEYYAYIIKRCKKPSQLKNAHQTFQILTRILHFMGFLDLSELDREGAEKIAHAYQFRPKNPDKYAKLRGLQGFELVAKNESLNPPKQYIKQSTALGHLEKMSTFLNWAKSRGYVAENVFYKLSLKNSTKGKSVFPFNSKQLSAIFSMPDYMSHKYLHPYYYWLPILLRYTGARMNELCQLRKADVVLADGIYCIWIREGSDDQTVKTGKMRLVPLHDEILAKGFIEFVNSITDVRLFPELPLVNGYYSNNASKWFARRREKLGMGPNSGFDGHSFRRSFIDELKQQLVTKNLVENIVGHEHAEKITKLSNELVSSIIGQEHNSESFDTYGEQYSPRILAPIVNMIDASHTAHIRPYNLA